MVKTVLALLLGLFSYASVAKTIKVIDILPPEKENEQYLILASDARVYELHATDEKSLELVYLAKETRSSLSTHSFSLGVISEILSLRPSIDEIKPYSQKITKEFSPTPTEGFEPTVFNSSEETIRYFQSMRTDTRWRSECYNRAYVWNYELWKNHGLKTRKVFMFFTKKYIREFNYGWWFHVAPLAKVNTGNATLEVVLDREFSRSPQLLEVWKNDYIRNRAKCPEVQKYSDYSEHQYEAYCYFIKASMYYWQPLDLENLEKYGTQITDWNDWKLRVAYRDAIR